MFQFAPVQLFQSQLREIHCCWLPESTFPSTSESDIQPPLAQPRRFSKVPGPVARNQQLTADGSLIFGPKSPCSGTTVPQLFPQPFSSVSQYTDLSSQIIGESQINTLAAAYLRRPDSMQPCSSEHFHLDVLSAIRGSETEHRERMMDYSSPIWS